MVSAKPQFVFSTEAYADVPTHALVIPVFKPVGAAAKGEKLLPVMDAPLKALDEAFGGFIQQTLTEEKFDGGKNKLLLIRPTEDHVVESLRVLLVGLGEASKVTPEKLETAVQKAVESATGTLQQCETMAFALPKALTDALGEETAVQSAVDGFYQGTYRSLESLKPGPALKKVTLLVPKAASKELKEALAIGEALADARSYAKDLVNHPANLKTTQTLVEAAQALSRLPNISVTVQSDVAWIEKNMPCFFTVAQGSLATDPPKFITVTYAPTAKRKKQAKKIALVGKSVIFDTGGYQVKPGDAMVTMKGDMTGGAMVLATMRALAELAPQNVVVTAYLAATPNKIDSGAMIPDSIVDTTCGKKVEIRHTDAEGRLTLIDAVAKAAETKPDSIVTIATLTGSAMRAVGLCIALMSNNDDLRGRVLAAAKALGEPMQALDVFESDYEDIQSKLDGADILNTSKNKNRGAQSAAAFVMSGAPEGTPVAHLDIAGADMTGDEKATGIGQKTLIRFILDEDQAAAS